MGKDKPTAPPPSLDFLTKGPSGTPDVIRCPKCKESDFDAHQNQYELVRTCRKCKNVWSGGSVGAGVAVIEPSQLNKQFVPPNQPAPLAENDPELDLPSYYDAPYRRY